MSSASLVYDGKTFNVPESMGTPCHHQLTGTPLENLGELASRKCYESLGYDANGKPLGRSSQKLHQHILEVNNTSVYEHCNVTLAFAPEMENIYKFMASCLNRKGVHVAIKQDDVIKKKHSHIQITANFRAILEWGRYSTFSNHTGFTTFIGGALWDHARIVAPMIFSREGHYRGIPYVPILNEHLDDDQAWISMYLRGSRGFTHEQVRHRYAVSQRSTRYVDESESEFLYHPLVKKLFESDRRYLKSLTAECDRISRKTYKQIFSAIHEMLIQNGIDAPTARKQARGAARGFLPNNLSSDMIFSAPVSGWKAILPQRASKPADAEIRGVYGEALTALKSSQYGDRFSAFNLIPSPDKIGYVLS